MAKKELFRKKIFAWLIAALGAFPIDREGADITAIKTALGSVRAGQKLIIFPQGTRHAAEGETKKGAAMLAVKTRAPILPMYITCLLYTSAVLELSKTRRIRLEGDGEKMELMLTNDNTK